MSVLRAVLRCVLGGVALGLATLTTFSFVGVPIVPTGATGPVLRDALLSSEDLPPGYAPAPSAQTAAGGPCAVLLADPATGWSGAVEQDQRQAGTGSRLWEAVATPDGDALVRLRGRLASCASFQTDQGQTTVRELPAPLPGGYAFALSVRGATGSYEGYLAAGRVGAAAAVLRYLMPTRAPTRAPIRSEEAGVTLRTALAKLVAVTGPAQR